MSVFSLNFSSAGKGQFTAGKAKKHAPEDALAWGVGGGVGRPVVE